MPAPAPTSDGSASSVPPAGRVTAQMPGESAEVARALRVGDMANVVSLQAPLNELRGELERRGVLNHFIKLKGLETQELLEQSEQTKGDQGERKLN